MHRIPTVTSIPCVPELAQRARSAFLNSAESRGRRPAALLALGFYHSALARNLSPSWTRPLAPRSEGVRTNLRSWLLRVKLLTKAQESVSYRILYSNEIHQTTLWKTGFA